MGISEPPDGYHDAARDLGDDPDHLIRDRDTATRFAKMTMMNELATYEIIVDLAEQVIDGRLDLPSAAERLQVAAGAARGMDGFSDLDRFPLDLPDWGAIVADEVEERRE